MDEAVKPWEQLDDESDQAFERFQTYLRLGPARTLTLAYTIWKAQEAKLAEAAAEEAGVAGLLPAPEGGAFRPKQAKRPSGQFRETARCHRWAQRAMAFDQEQFSLTIHEGTQQWAEGVGQYIRLLLKALPGLPPGSFKELTDGFAFISSIITPEILRSMATHNRNPVAINANCDPGLVGPANEGSAGGQVP